MTRLATRFLHLFALVAVVSAAALPARAGGLAVSDAWIALAPPNMRAHAGYFTLTNAGETAVLVTGVAAEGYVRAMLHESRMSDGVMSMVHLDAIEVAPGASVAFRPGGLHLMLMGPGGPQTEGASVPITLTLGDGTTLSVEAEIRRRGGGHGGHATHGHDG
ncbi:MAG: copper chaperone PCu(A)C [Pseudomonadota bacterium]